MHAAVDCQLYFDHHLLQVQAFRFFSSQFSVCRLLVTGFWLRRFVPYTPISLIPSRATVRSLKFRDRSWRCRCCCRCQLETGFRFQFNDEFNPFVEKSCRC
jgi:hypothetical protein